MTGTNEKKINLEIARKVRKELEERGYQVVMTREDDNGLYTDSDSNKKTADMKKRCHMAEENNAEAIQASFKQNLDPENGREAKANDSYYILLNVKCPAVIAECGFLSNYEEAELLEQEKYQEKVAKAVAEGVEAYFSGKQLKK